MADLAVGARARPHDRRQWIRVFLGGLLLWAATVVVSFWTANPNLVPTVILLGSFLVPATFVIYAMERHADQVLTGQRVFTASCTGVCSACSAPPSWRRSSSSSPRSPPTSGSG
jgi:protease PrsW